MTYAELHNTINGRFKAQVATPQSLTTIYDGDPTDPPTDGSRWCRFYVVDGDAHRITCGVKRYRLVGYFNARLHWPVSTGIDGPMDMVDAIVSAFRAQTVGGVRYGTPYPQIQGREGEYEIIDIICPFRADTQEVA